MHRYCGLLAKSRHGTVIQLSLSCLLFAFLPLKVIFNSKAKYLTYTGFLSCTAVGVNIPFLEAFFFPF